MIESVLFQGWALGSEEIDVSFWGWLYAEYSPSEAFGTVKKWFVTRS